MIGAFPESCLVVVTIDRAVGADAPEPFTVSAVEQVRPDILPCIVAPPQECLVAGSFVHIEKTDDSFGLYPPVTVRIDAFRLRIVFVDQTSVGSQSLDGRGCQCLDHGTDICRNLRFSEYEGGFVDEAAGDVHAAFMVHTGFGDDVGTLEAGDRDGVLADEVDEVHKTLREKVRWLRENRGYPCLVPLPRTPVKWRKPASKPCG